MSSYRFSHSVSAAELKKCGVFTTIEVRSHNQEDLAYQGSREFVEDVSKSWDCKTSWRSCAQENRHLMALCVPECLPERLALVSAICDLFFLQDGSWRWYPSSTSLKTKANKAQDIFENTTDAQRENGTPGETDGFGSVLRQKGLPPDSLARFPQLKKDIMKKLLVKDPNLALWIPQELDRVVTAPPRDRMTYNTLESYMDERLTDVAMKWFYDLCAYGMALKLNEKEQEQSRIPTLAMQKAIIYTNDLFSWAKEKAEQERVAPKKDVFNAVAVLMKEHDVSENRALDWLREKTLECEKDHFAAVSDLELAGPVSDNLYRYLDMTRLCHSGAMFWSAFTDRYNSNGPAQTKGDVTKKDRAALGSMAIEISAETEVPTPPPNAVVRSDDHAVTGNALHVQTQAAGANGSTVNGENIYQVNGTKELEEVDGNNASLKELAKDTVLAPYQYLRFLPSKGLRELLIDGLNLWLQVPELSLEKIRKIVVMLHTSSLMLDDIEDGSKLRRGMPSAHMLYGESQTINSAGYVQIRAFAEVAKLPNPAAVSVFCEESANLYIGQSLDLLWKYHVDCPSEEDYLEMVDGKTGGLFRMTLRLMQAESPFGEKYGPELTSFIKGLGRYFQIRDDYQNLTSSNYARQKGSCEDLDEGKISLPFIHSMQSSSQLEKAQITGIFRARNANGLLPEIKAFVLKHLDEGTASLAYTRGMLKAMERDLKENLAAVEEICHVPNPLLRSLLAKLEL